MSRDAVRCGFLGLRSSETGVQGCLECYIREETGPTTIANSGSPGLVSGSNSASQSKPRDEETTGTQPGVGRVGGRAGDQGAVESPRAVGLSCSPRAVFSFFCVNPQGSTAGWYTCFHLNSGLRPSSSCDKLAPIGFVGRGSRLTMAWKVFVSAPAEFRYRLSLLRANVGLSIPASRGDNYISGSF
jgi:hypothetical protein